MPPPDSVGSSSSPSRSELQDFTFNKKWQTKRRQRLGRRRGNGVHLRSVTMDDGEGSIVEETVEKEGDAMPWNLRSAGRSEEEAPATRLSIPLSAEEIAEDIYGITGRLPRKRPRKRPQAVQIQLKRLFPGLSLSEKPIKAEKYEVPDYG